MNSSYESNYRPKKRFFRSRMRGKITGVCAGIADYFNLDISYVRLAAIVSLCIFTLATVVAYVLTTVLTDRI
ncbi:MAG: PspC domain-containing protein [Kangiellaceae bacterium]|nr:PspC domain-containing protein [Kangiellaceae bacterium]